MYVLVSIGVSVRMNFGGGWARQTCLVGPRSDVVFVRNRIFCRRLLYLGF